MKISGPMLLSLALSASLEIFAAGVPSGMVIGWGDDTTGAATGVPHQGYSTGPVTRAGSRLTNAVAVAAGSGFGLALRQDGAVVWWGENQGGSAADDQAADRNGVVHVDGRILSNVVSIAAEGTLALRSDGTVVTWGKTKVPSGA